MSDYFIPPDHIVHDDQVFTQSPPNLWHLPKSTWTDIWNRVTGKTVDVAILDTGYVNHPDLPQPKATKSFVGQPIQDRNSHGTHVAGTALGRNGLGVAPEANLLVGKVLSDSGSGSSRGIADGIRWAVNAGADVISLSLGSNSPDEGTRQAAKFALQAGAVLVAAAGNAGYRGSNTIGYPAKFFEFLCIGATQSNGSIANFSSGGREIDIATPGQNIISASIRGGYISMSGTSMATPYSAGLIALVIELMRREGYAAMTGVDAWRKFLEQWSEDKGNPGKDVRYGYGVPRYSDIVESLVGDEIKWT